MGTRINKRLAGTLLAAAAFLVIILIWVPRIHFRRGSLPTITPAHLPNVVQPALQRVTHPFTPPAPTPRAQPTPCQPCIQAAQEVLQRYLTAIRTGAGPDDRQEQANVMEAPRVYTPAPSLSAYAGPVRSDPNVYDQHERQLRAYGSVPSYQGATR